MLKRLGIVLLALALFSGSAGALAPAASAATSTFTPVADTYIDQSLPAANHGSAAVLQVDSSPVQRQFIKFTVSGLSGPVTSAKLRIHSADTAEAGSNFGGHFRSSSNTSWTEPGLVWNNRPPLDGAVLGTLNAVARNSWSEINVTSLVKGNGTYTIAATSTSADGALYDSRETGATAPQLTVTSDPGTPGDPVLVGAGDIATCGATGDEATAALLDGIEGTVFNAGDNVYPNGTATEFSNCYGPSWGRHKARTMPVVGNHEYNTPGATGYYGYFGAAAGDPARGYYSYDRGNWHIVALNSNCAQIGGCQAGSAQEQWLRADLAASTKPCTAAIWHHPLFTSGSNHGPATETRPLFQALYEHNAEVVVTGHNHNYERFAPQNPAGTADAARGIREFVVGTGGASHYGFGTTQPNSEARNADTYGVLKLTLHASSYDWKFMPEAGKTYTDSGTTSCH